MDNFFSAKNKKECSYSEKEVLKEIIAQKDSEEFLDKK